ncbi:MAG: CoA-binding protein [Actinobacteria bacterium]|uniref:Unannotated protein n=1 Tax=freshwater metagenome TaxID=449393 RepID=A0A6J5YL60_9ZZZZ|nr:CoA-binding protein [Actinomycetota bacterium]
MYHEPNRDQLHQLLTQAQTVAVIGVSAKPDRASHQVAAYLIEHTHYTVYLINPTHDGTILGQQVYQGLSELPETPDIIDVFRKGEDMPGVFAHEFAAIEQQCKGITWWMQLGIRNEEVAETAMAKGMNVIMDRCLKVDYMQLVEL